MKNKYNNLLIIALSIFVSCKSSKTSNFNTNASTNETVISPVHSHDYFGAYDIEDVIFGTKTKVTIVGDKRIMTTNSLPNHETGTFPTKGNPNTITAQNKTYTFPLNPKYTGIPKRVRETGTALNGVKFEPGTAEVVVCDTGENYRVEAFQTLINLGLDFNHAHVQPTGEYHYHGTPTSAIENFDTGEDLVHIGFAKDGFPIYFSKTEAYKPSYKLVEGDRAGEDCTYTTHHTIDISVGGKTDGTFTSDFEFLAGLGDLDECNGITIDGKYMYLVTNSYPYVSRCLMGEFPEERGPGGQGGQGGQRNQSAQRAQGERPNTAQIFERMDSDKDGKLSEKEVKGPLAENFSKLDSNKDGFITKEELEKQEKGIRQQQ